ncbi:MAG: hypothetical protein KIT58_04095 [Planctomycetota bacterium]|nr:hypothetical protein [Planctomycetota bacterium]
MSGPSTGRSYRARWRGGGGPDLFGRRATRRATPWSPAPSAPGAPSAEGGRCLLVDIRTSGATLRAAAAALAAAGAGPVTAAMVAR